VETSQYTRGETGVAGGRAEASSILPARKSITSSVSEAGAASPVGEGEQGHGGECVLRSTARGGSGADEIEAGHLMSRADVPPHGIERFERDAAAAPGSQRQGQARDEDNRADPGREAAPVSAEQKAKANAAATDWRLSDAELTNRRPPVALPHPAPTDALLPTGAGL